MSTSPHQPIPASIGTILRVHHVGGLFRAPRHIVSGFTLIELLMAMAIGLVISNIALASFIATQKYIYRMERLSAMNDAAQSMILWCLTKQGREINYPNTPQFRGIAGAVTATAEICTLNLYDTASATPLVALPGCTLYVPVTGN